MEDVSGNQDKAVNGSQTPGEAPLCVYFINGSCNRGSGCPFSHSLQAKRPACKFFYSLQVSFVWLDPLYRLLFGVLNLFSKGVYLFIFSKWCLIYVMNFLDHFKLKANHVWNPI